MELMEIPLDVQNNIKCSECNELMSCGPVYLLHQTGGTICGRCSQHQPNSHESTGNNGKSRIFSYEATASLLAFPCVFAANGCPEKVPFSLGLPPHESHCKFRSFLCPMGPQNSCNWVGPWPKFEQHYKDCHPDNILENPCDVPRPLLITSNQQSYLISTFNFLFLLQIKVCLTSGKLFHSLRMFGDSNFVEKFSYKLNIDGNNMKISKTGVVLPPGHQRAIEDAATVYTTINCLAGILSVIESKFTIRIQAQFKYCANCFNEINEAQFCPECLEKLIKCKFHENECVFEDVDKKKCLKHERFFCKYQTKCKCGEEFAAGSYTEHLKSSSSCRKTSTSSIDSVFRLTRNIDNEKKMIIYSSKDYDTVICEYKLKDNKLSLRLFTQMASHDLQHFKCLIKFCDPLTKFTRFVTPDMFVKDSWWDWYLNLEMYDFKSWRKHGTDMKIMIERK